MRGELGQSLSEILIALFFSSFISSMLGQAYFSVKTHYLWQEKQLEAAQSAMLLSGWLKDTIHPAGYFGCNHQSQLHFENEKDMAYLSQAI